ncbi:hypothetical protein H096_22133 [Pseudomonas sp. FH1]|nr:hypothetical protein H096_22133 [Pseudomonas sp. FH1]
MLLTTSADHGLIIGVGKGLCQAGGDGKGEREREKTGWIRLQKVIQPSIEKKLKEPPVSESSIPGH